MPCSQDINSMSFNTKEKQIAYNRKYQKDHPEKVRAKCLKYRYGISIEQYDAMLKSQGGKCAICKTKKGWGQFTC